MRELLFPALFTLASPYYLLKMQRRGNWRSGFSQRFGRYEQSLVQSLAGRDVFWLHAVSVGEINVCVELVRVLESLSPGTKFVISTTTTTGMGELQKRAPEHITKIYYPVDCRSYVRRALETIRPKAIILLEAEIWPNLIWQAAQTGILLFLVNARVSDRSYPRYKRAGFLFKGLFGALTTTGAQSEDYAAKLQEIGCPPENVHVTGNLKFDTAKLDVGSSLDVPALLTQLGVDETALPLVAGSTHHGEEKILAREFLRLRRQFPKLFLIVAPRHGERIAKVERTLNKCGVRFFRRSQIRPETKLKAGTMDCLIVDTMGELMSFYNAATVVFVGKSLTTKGGQNPIEPAALRRPVVFGPNMQNFADVARLFVSQLGAVQVKNAKELGTVLAELLADSERRKNLGQTAKRIVEENRGAVLRTAKMILERVSLPPI